jgi:hypothetical protein
MIEAIAAVKRAYINIIAERQLALKRLNSLTTKLPDVDVSTISMSSYQPTISIYLPAISYDSFNDGELAQKLDSLITATAGDPDEIVTTDDPNERKRTFEWRTTILLEDLDEESVFVNWIFAAYLAEDSTCTIIVERTEQRTTFKWVEIVEDVPIMKFVCPQESAE